MTQIGLTVEVRQEVPLLPKVAFVLISLASLAGAVFTGLHLGLGPFSLGARWLLLWLTGLALGFSAWRVLYLREEPDLGVHAQGFVEEEKQVWQGFAQRLGLALLLLSPLPLSFAYLGAYKGLLTLAQTALGLSTHSSPPTVQCGPTSSTMSHPLNGRGSRPRRSFVVTRRVPAASSAGPAPPVVPFTG